MKKSIVILTGTCLIALGSFAQVKNSNEGGFILKGGVNLANISIEKSGKVDDAKQLTSFNVGFAVDVPLAVGLSLQPGLLFTGKGAKTQLGEETNASYYRTTSNPMYVELPLNVVGKIPLGGSAHIILGAGPYAAVGVAGKNKTQGKVFGVAFNRENNIDFSDDDPTTSQEEGAGFGKLKRFDYGLNALGGVDLGKVILSANYGLGLAKVTSGTTNSDNDKNKNRVVSISLGFKL